MDMGSYVVHMARMLGGGEPIVVSARAELRGPDVDRAMTASLRFPGGHTATVHCSMWSSSLLHLAVRVTGDGGELRVFNPIAPQCAGWLPVATPEGRRVEVP
jgi:predicted dehydrogenase